jgi:hypothetical protein
MWPKTGDVRVLYHVSRMEGSAVLFLRKREPDNMGFSCVDSPFRGNDTLA